MMNIKTKAKDMLSMIGVNKAVAYFLMGKGFSFITTPLTLYFIATFLSPYEQGYYYTFSSLLGLSIFFELGLGVVITQFASHEYAGLSWSEQGSLQGDPSALSRVISLVRKSIKWYGVIAGLFVLVVLPSGWVFLSSKAQSSGISYILPWILLVIFFGLNTTLIPMFAVLEGCGKVAQVQQIRVTQAVSGVLLSWTCFLAGGKLLASPAEFTAYLCVMLIWLNFRYREFIKQIFTFRLVTDAQVSWFREVFPMQWKIAISWLAAYFSGYLFVPLVFAFRDPVEAGKMGMSLKIGGIIYTLSMAWINTRVPNFGALIQKKEYKKLDKLAAKSTLQALGVGLCISIVTVLGLVFISHYVPKYQGRVLSEYVVALLCVANLANVATSAMAGYLRAHKTEPLMPVLVMIAVLISITSYLAARYYNADMIIWMYTLISVAVSLPVIWMILLKKRREWHGI